MRFLTGIGLFCVSLHAQLSSSVATQLSPQEKQLNIESFEKVWTTVRDHHWEKKPGGLDWQAIHDEYRPKIEKAGSTEAARAVMSEMLGRLHQTHFGIIPATVYHDVDVALGDGSPGLDLRVIDGQAVVTRVLSCAHAENSCVKTGCSFVSANGKDLAPVIEKLKTDYSLPFLKLERT